MHEILTLCLPPRLMSKTQRTVAWQELMQKYTGMRKKFVWLWQRRKFCSAAFWKHQKATELRARWCAWALYNLNVYKNHYVFTSQSLMCSTDIIVLLKTDRHEFIASLLWRNNTVFVASQYNSALTQWFHIFWCHKADFVKTKCVTIQQDNWLQSRFTLRGFKFFHSIFNLFVFIADIDLSQWGNRVLKMSSFNMVRSCIWRNTLVYH